MFERRKSFRVPFRSKLIFSMPSGVFVGNTDNISAGGISIRSFETNVAPETKLHCLMQLEPDEAPLSLQAIIKRVIQPTSNPEDIPGLGLAFVAEPATRDLVVVALSASAVPDEVAAAREAGAADYWTKPIDFERFIDGMRQLLPPGSG